MRTKDSTNVVDHDKMDVNWFVCAGQLENIFADLTECGIVLSKLKTEVLPNTIKFILESVQIISRIKSKSKDFLKKCEYCFGTIFRRYFNFIVK